jgi:hypothetical protein
MRVLNRLIAGLVTVVAAALFNPASAFACDCHEGGPVCEAFWTTPVVFVGQVQAVMPIRPTVESGPSQRVRFRVTESLRGTTAREVELFNYPTTCHFAFVAGEDWVIYAFPRGDGPGLTTFTCSRSRPLHVAEEDLRYARSAYTQSWSAGRIFGRLAYSSQTGGIPVAGVRLRLAGPPWAGSLTAVTDRAGRYEVRGPAGAYRLTADLPPGMSVLPLEQFIELPDDRGCANVDLWADYPGQVTGRVVTASGAPVPNLAVELIDIDPRQLAEAPLRGNTDLAGRFRISGVRPGAYLERTAIAYDRFPGGVELRYVFLGGTTMSSARRVEVKGGLQVAVGDLALPRTVRIAQITGTVVRVDGRPAPNSRVRTKADFDGPQFGWTTLDTNSHGRFVFALVVGMPYRIVAEGENSVGTRQTALTIHPSQTMSPVRLVVQ